MSKIVDGLLGLAIGDAMGVPIEFSIREKCLNNPVVEMVGFGSHDVPAGSWSDDTSMTIATMDSFIEMRKFDYNDIMKKWYQWAIDYKYTPCDLRFDIGHTCFEAIYNYSKKNMEPLKCGLTNIKSNGNGSLMRILPVAYYCYYKKVDKKEIYKLVKDISSLTHAHEISVLGCYIYVLYVIKLLNGENKITAYKSVQKEDYSMFNVETIKVYKRILENDISVLNINDINSGGYVLDTLEASLWVTLKSNNFKESIIGSINLGQDTDTTGAVTGSLTGIIYGYETFPKKWVNKLIKRDYLIEIANQFDMSLNDFFKDPVLGAIIGDIVGSRFEINHNKYLKDFEFFNKYCRYTDDTVMSLCVAKSIIDCKNNYDNLSDIAIKRMVETGKKHSKCGFGPSFYNWIMNEKHEPYNSYGNGSAMRISACGVFAKTKKEVVEISKKITEVSHNHPDGILGAEAIAMMIYYIKNNKTKEELKQIFEKDYYKIDFNVEQLQSNYKGDISCSETVPQAFECFYESNSFEDAIRNAISIGGDSDTLAAICGSLASAYYGVPSYFKNAALKYLTNDLLNIYKEYENKLLML